MADDFRWVVEPGYVSANMSNDRRTKPRMGLYIISLRRLKHRKGWAYQRLEESIERLKPHVNELNEHQKGIFNLGQMELMDAAQAGEDW